MTDYTDLKARLRAWPQHGLLAAALAAIDAAIAKESHE